MINVAIFGNFTHNTNTALRKLTFIRKNAEFLMIGLKEKRNIYLMVLAKYFRRLVYTEGRK